MDTRVAGLREALRERLASLAQDRPLPWSRPAEFVRELPRGFEPHETGSGIAWRRVDFVAAPEVEPANRCSYFDTETTGLSWAAGTLVFAAAVAHPVPGGLELVQLFLAEPGGEPAFLHLLARELKAAQRIGTYNGRRFDLPILRNRCVMAGLDPELVQPEHIDLLELARPLLRAALGSCALRNVEQRLLKLEREDDLPSFLVPEAYFRYLRLGSCDELEAALSHNRQDVISLCHLHQRLLQRLDGSDRALDAVDLLALGRYHLRGGRQPAAVRALRKAVDLGEGEASAAAAITLAALLLKRGHALAAERTLATAQASSPDAPGLASARARILEWRLRDVAEALRVVEQGLLHCPHGHAATHDLVHRRARLMRRLTRAREHRGQSKYSP